VEDDCSEKTILEFFIFDNLFNSVTFGRDKLGKVCFIIDLGNH
jgi:hypothetical protein